MSSPRKRGPITSKGRGDQGKSDTNITRETNDSGSVGPRFRGDDTRYEVTQSVIASATHAWLATALPSAACAAARRAIGTRYGEQDT